MMETLYTIDSGNTNLKVTKFSPSGEVLDVLILNSLEELSLNDQEQAIFCSVNKEIPNGLSKNIVNFNLLKKKLSLSTSYSETIGNDRLALVYYLQNIYPGESFIAVDAGSFITIDIVISGKHEGGYIFPGLKTFLSIYSINGKNLPGLEIPNTKIESIPVNTKQAIEAAFQNYIESIETKIKSFNISNILVTGGDANKLTLSDANYEKDLLAKALYYIFKEFNT
ncbi:MAG: hypothetical protein BM556_04650 [Bacteriovorax sp. MedPE-SWde]|nr:MAG: hypothetical protein BM556_04650 [Bacteriovorax sp. MedPE-SWde]